MKQILNFHGRGHFVMDPDAELTVRALATRIHVEQDFRVAFFQRNQENFIKICENKVREAFVVTLFGGIIYQSTES